MGYILGTTAASIMYLRAQRSGFTVLPLAKHKTYYYAQIFFVGYLAYKFGSGVPG